MNAPLLSLETTSETDFAKLLRTGGFDVAPMNEQPWATEAVSWQAFLCHRQGAVVTASVALDKTGKSPAAVVVGTCRKLLWVFARPGDVRLVRDVVSHLLKSGAHLSTPADDLGASCRFESARRV